jgi:hypothetical protein
MNEQHLIEERSPNWLPLPGEEMAVKRRVAVVDANDLFCKAEVATYYPKQRCGILKNERGALIPFSLDEAFVIGDLCHLEPAGRVGYDASCTSHGQRVTKLKIY